MECRKTNRKPHIDRLQVGASNKNQDTVRRVERILIKKAHPAYKDIVNACERTRKVRNAANYLIRQSFFDKDRENIFHSDADKYLKQYEKKTYQLLPSAASQRAIQILGKEWKSFFMAAREYAKNKGKFEKPPRPPKYKKGLATFCIGRNGFSIKKGYIIITPASRQINISPIKTRICNEQNINEKASKTIVQDIRFVPIGSAFYIEIVYKNKEKQTACDLDQNNYLSIDFGIDNFATIISNQQEIHPVLIKGKIIKSINAKYNKDCAVLRSKKKGKHIKSKSAKRNSRIENYLHHTSAIIIQHAIDTRSKTIVLGKNKGWKKQINIGKINNQKFGSIPHARLISKIQYKAEEKGISVITKEESYTSKASALDLDVMPIYRKESNTEKKKHKFFGKRIKRGLYKTKDGLLLNADVNGAINILRKEIGNDFVKNLTDKGCVTQPKRVNPLVLERSLRASETLHIGYTCILKMKAILE